MRKKMPVRFLVHGILIALAIMLAPDLLRAFWFNEFNDNDKISITIVAIMVLIAGITSTFSIMKKKYPKNPGIMSKKQVNSILIRIASIMFVATLTNHLLRIFWPSGHDDLAMIIIVPIGLLAAIIVSIPAARRRGWGGLWF